MTFYIILSLGFILFIGLYEVNRLHSQSLTEIGFTNEYRSKFIQLHNKYFDSYDSWSRVGNVDNELYVWLTLNSNKIQSNLGNFGVLDYTSAYRTYKVTNYPVIINTIPKFRDGTVKHYDSNSLDDCLLRYIGFLHEYEKITSNYLKNPLIWFREGIKKILSAPLLILNSLGLFSQRAVSTITNSLIFKVFAGIAALVTFMSALVTIIVGYDQTKEFILKYFSN
jgi:hypothetical protein